MSDCPSDDDLTGFLNESLPPDKITILSAHVDGCAKCQDRLDTLTHDTDGAIARYKDLSSVMPSASDLRTAGGAAVSSPDAGTLILGGTPLLVPQLTGLPRVPGFDVAAEIGRGGMGVVYRARHRRLNRLVALKMILAGGAADTRTVQRFLFEAEILARVQHPQVVQVFEVDTYQGPSGVPIPYLAIELLEGGSLSHRLKSGGRLDPRAAAELIEGIARAVHAAHAQGVVHRDLKPGNILFPAAGGQQPAASEEKKETTTAPSSLSTVHTSLAMTAPKVTDFGLAKFTEAGADLTGSGQVVGTPHYMAPEQAAGNKQIGPPADVYALGAILFECLTGRTPFQGSEPMSVLLKVVSEVPPDVRTLRPEVPRDLGAVVMRCLEKDARRRYASADELANDLRRFLENRPTKARPVTGRERLWLWTKRNPAVAGLLTALAVVLVTGFGAVTYLWAEERQAAIDARLATDLSKIAQKRSDESHKETAKALKQVEQARTNADLQRAHLEFAQAVNWCEEGRIEDGLEYFVKTIELAEATGAPDLARVARMNLAAWPRELPPALRALPHSSQPRLAAFMPNGRHMVTAGRGAYLFLWDTTTGERIRSYKAAARLRRPYFAVFAPTTFWTVAVSPDGKRIAAGGTDGQITVWDVDSPAPIASVDAFDDDLRALENLPEPEASSNVWSLAFASNSTLWTNDGQDGVTRWELDEKSKPGSPRRIVPQRKSRYFVNVLVVSRDGKRVYSGDRGGVVREWDAEKFVELRAWFTGGWVQDIALSPDDKRVAVTGPEGVARVFELPPYPAPPRLALDLSLGSAYGNGIAFAPKRPLLLTSDGDGNVRFWRADTGMPVGLPIRLAGEVTKIRFRPDSDEFAVPAGDVLYLSRVPDPTFEVISAGYGSRIRGLDLSPTGDRLAVSDENRLEVFDLHVRGSPPDRMNYGGRLSDRIEPLLTLRFDPNPARSFVFRGTRIGCDRVEVSNRMKPQALPRGLILNKVHRIAFLRDDGGPVVIDDKRIARFDPVQPILREFRMFEDKELNGVDLGALAVRPNADELLVTIGNRVVFLDSRTFKELPRKWNAGDVILDAKYTPDGEKILVGRRDNMAELLSARDGTRIGRQMTHERAVVAVAVSPDGKMLLTGSRDGTARFWDAATGLPLGAPLRHIGPVTHVVYARDGKRVATGTGTGHALLWDVPPPAAKGTLDELRAAIKKNRDPAPGGN